MAQVIIGVDPHKRSATIEIINAREKALGVLPMDVGDRAEILKWVRTSG